MTWNVPETDGPFLAPFDPAVTRKILGLTPSELAGVLGVDPAVLTETDRTGTPLPVHQQTALTSLLRSRVFPYGLAVRGLLAWMLFGFVLTLFVVGALSAGVTESFDISFALSDHTSGLLFGGLLWSWTGLWLLRHSHRGRLEPIAFFRVDAEAVRVPEILTLVAMLMAFSFGAFYLLWYPLSFVAPSFTEEWALTAPIDFAFPETARFPLLNNIAIGLGTVLLGPVIEELVFRGILFNRWAIKWGVRRAAIVSSMLFGIAHANVIGGTMTGIVLCLLYMKSGGLGLPILVHAVNNAAVLVLAALPFVGYSARYSIVELRADAWWGFTLLAVTTPFVWSYLKSRWPRAEVELPYVSRYSLAPRRLGQV